MKWFRRKPKPPKPARHYDYTRCYRGHDYIFIPRENGLQASAMGWGYGIEEGDILDLKGPNDGVSPYRVESISYYSDPRDMWSAELRYCGEDP